jgi:hypothetical protein
MAKDTTQKLILLLACTIIIILFVMSYIKIPQQDVKVVPQGTSSSIPNGWEYGLKIISGLILIIGFFVVYYFKQVNDIIKDLNKTLNALTTQLTSITQWKEDFIEMNKQHMANCNVRFDKIEKQKGKK